MQEGVEMRSKNRIRKIYKGYDKALKPFKTEMIEAMQNNKAFGLIFGTAIDIINNKKRV